MEDLWCFNDKTLVEAIFACQTPVVSAVGHEVDYTLCDFVADVRGATPSHAAELSIYPLSELEDELQQKLTFLHDTVRYRIQQEQQKIYNITNRKIVMPAITLVHQQKSTLQHFEHTLHGFVRKQLQDAERKLAILGTQLENKNPLSKVIKGFAKVDVNDKPLQTIDHVKVGDKVEIHIQDGSISAIVQEVTHRD